MTQIILLELAPSEGYDEPCKTWVDMELLKSSTDPVCQKLHQLFLHAMATGWRSDDNIPNGNMDSQTFEDFHYNRTDHKPFSTRAKPATEYLRLWYGA